jgi:16S rRNA G966 N2-methylase RsmD
MLIFGDNLQAMKTLLQWKAEGRLVNPDGSRGVKLVYIDPPFATKEEFRAASEERAYRDKVMGPGSLSSSGNDWFSCERFCPKKAPSWSI